MKVALFLHAYQPPTQFPEVTKKITEESYKPIIKVLLGNPEARLTLNLAGSLTEQFVNFGEEDLLQQISELTRIGRLELTSTAIYHPLLAKIPDREIKRQIKLNNQINSAALGNDNFAPRGVFIPEMFYERYVAEVVSSLGYQWIIVDESAYPGAGVVEKGQHLRLEIGKYIHEVQDLPLNVFFRNRPLSLELAFNSELTADFMVERLKEHYLEGQESYAVIAIDAETFGHHQKDNLQLLVEIMNHPNIEPVTVSELLIFGFSEKKVDPLGSTWGLAIEDVRHNRTFPRWDNPNNLIHKMQWELFNLALKVGKHKSNEPDLFDKALHSDQFWWASHNPCWYPEMLRRGAEMLRMVIEASTRVSAEEISSARSLYDQIIQTGKELFGEGIIAC